MEASKHNRLLGLPSTPFEYQISSLHSIKDDSPKLQMLMVLP